MVRVWSIRPWRDVLIFAAGLLVALIACCGVERFESCDKTVSKRSSTSFRHVNAQTHSSNLRLGDRPLKVTSEVKPSKKPLFVAIKTKELNLESTAVQINSTWLSDCASKEDCVFFTPSGRDKAEAQLNMKTVEIPEVALASPAHAGTLAVLKYIAAELVDLYDWFLVVSDNVYVRPKKLIEFLRHLDPMDKVYLGQPGLGNPEHRAELQLRPGEVFCMSGPGIVFSSRVVREAAIFADKCLMGQSPSRHEAVELGRCFSRQLGIQCTWAYELEKLFLIDYSSKLFQSELSVGNSRLQRALTLYPVASAKVFHSLDKFYRDNEIQELQELLAKATELKKRTSRQ